MNYRLNILPQAMADFADSAAWYEEKQSGLGERFTREVLNAIDTMALNPLIHRPRHRHMDIRWCYPPNFPYRIVYHISENTITVVAVIHAARRI